MVAMKKDKKSNQKQKSDEEIGKEAAEIAHDEILKRCDKIGVTTDKVLTRINEGLDATENKVFYDKDRGRCVLSPDLIAWGVRTNSIDQAMTVRGMKAPEKIEHTINDLPGLLRAARERAAKR